MIVQVAGIKSVAEAKKCLELGVDFIGLLVGQKHTSLDFIDAQLAGEIIKEITNKKVVIITHLTDAEEIIKIINNTNVLFIQLHSNIRECEVEKIKKVYPKIKLIRLIHVSYDGVVVTEWQQMKYVDYYFIDSFNNSTGQVGGTGKIHDWKIDKLLLKQLNKPTFIAGGLTPKNVAEAIKQIKPYGVDANSSLKNKKKLSDFKAIEMFVKNAKM